MMAQVNAGRVRFVGRGEYNNSTQYYVFDLVNYNGNSYYAKVDTIGNLPTNTTYWQLVAEKGNVGPTGLTGNGISSITKTGTSGLVDTYTITYTNGNTTTFDVSNGNGIDRIEKTATVGNIDTYTIYFNDNSTSTFEVANGEVTREELEEEVDRLSMIYNAFPTTSDEGEEMTLNGTAEVPFKKIGLKGNTSQFSTTGKNLLNKELFTSSEKISAITMLDTGVQFITTSEASSSTYGRTTANIPLDSTKTYTISCDVTSDKSGKFILGYYGTSGGSLTTNITENTKKSVSYQLSNITSSYVSLGFYLANATVKVENLMIVEGTTIGNYEPYTGGIPAPNPSYPYPVNVVTGNNTIKVEGKNLFDKDSPNIIANKYLDENGVLQNATRSSVSDYMKVLSNTVYSIQPYRMVSQRLCFYDKNKTFISSQSLASINPSFTTPSNCEYIRASFITEDIDIWQLEKGSTATTYTPYVSQTYPINLPIGTELCKIGDYQDYIYKYSGKWYLNKQIGKVVLDGSENWQLRNTSEKGTKTYSASDIPSDYLQQEELGGYAYCNKFVINKTVSAVSYMYNSGHLLDVIGISFYYNANNPNRNIYINTTETLPTYLQNNNANLYYKLATPTTTEITDSTLLSQLEAIKGANSYDDTTNISQTNADKPFILDVEAILSLKNIFNS